MPFFAVEVEGLAQLERSLSELGKDIQANLNRGLVRAAQPARALAEGLALQRISGMAQSHVPWNEMRVGTSGALVYMAPRQRGTTIPGRRRRNLSSLLIARAIEPALAHSEPQIEAAVGREVDTAIRKAGF